jgi:methylated-DNA-[protein]-cysteine S-methyltransferase
MSYSAIIHAPFAAIGLRCSEQGVSQVDFIYDDQLEQAADGAVATQAVVQLQQYLGSAEQDLMLPLQIVGTPFQLRVWQALREIPVGEVRRYGDLAKQLGSSAQAVGNACRANPAPLFVPCHRVVAATGIGGFGGATDGPELTAKRWLLAHEGVNID